MSEFGGAGYMEGGIAAGFERDDGGKWVRA